MNMLIDLAPVSISIDYEEYEINSDFRTSILFELLMQDKTLTLNQKTVQALNLYYPVLPHDLDQAVEKIMWFYSSGKTPENLGKAGKNSYTKIYCYNYDDEYIYAAFLDQYNIDLQDIEYLHWWKFKALFKSLKEDNEIVKIMGYRSMEIDSRMSREQQKYYRDLKKHYAIPVSGSERTRLNTIEEALLKNGDLSSIL